jgi:polyadenylation factor subunit 2
MTSAKFVTCSDDGTARVFDFATSKLELIFKEHNSAVTACDWHPFQSLIITGSKDCSIRIWDPRNNTS